MLGLSVGFLTGIGVTGGTVFLGLVLLVVVNDGVGAVACGLEGVVVVACGLEGVVVVAVGVCWVARACSERLVSLFSVIVAGGVAWSGGTRL